MAHKITQKELKHDEFVDAAFDFGHWIEENWPLVLRWVAVAGVVVLVTIAWVTWRGNNAERARSLLAQGISAYGTAAQGGFEDSAALESARATLVDAAKRGGRSLTGDVARFYDGMALFHLGRGEEAQEAIASVIARVAVDDTLGATARAFQARIQASGGQADEAIATMTALIDAEDAAAPRDQMLMQLAMIQKDAGREDDARQSLQRIVDEFPQSSVAADAKKQLGSDG